MIRDETLLLLEHFGILRSRCDLDLLLFFARHPRAMLSSEALAGFLGYDFADIASALDLLLAAGLLKREQTSAHAARMYVFAADPNDGGWLARLVHHGGTREGRLALRAILGGHARAASGRPEERAPHDGERPGPRRLDVEPARAVGGRRGPHAERRDQEVDDA